MSPEHYLPAGFGAFRGCERLRDRLCDQCNRRLGALDEVLLRTGFVGFFRQAVGVEGRDGERPSPFERGAHGVPRMVMQGAAPNAPYPMLWEPVAGSARGEDRAQAQPQRQIVFERGAGDAVPVFIPAWMRDNPDRLREELRRLGLEGATPVLMWSPLEDIPWISDLWEAVSETPPEDWQNPEPPAGEFQMAADVVITEEYLRAIAKVAFHYTLKVFPDLTGMEWQFNKIKHYIWTGAGGGRRRPVRQLEQQFLANFRMGQRPRYWSHILAADRLPQVIVAHVQFFASRRSSPLPFRVAIGRNPARIVGSMPDRRAHLFVMDPAVAGDGYAGIMEDAQVSRYIIPVGFTLG
jgi:hypothetical protein